jgi:hypothetical protein
VAQPEPSGRVPRCGDWREERGDGPRPSGEEVALSILLCVGSSEPHVSHLADRQIAALAEVASLLDFSGFDYWLFGGWAVDFHVGAVTRSHDDIDLAVWADDAGAIHSTLGANGWEHRPAADEDGGTGYARDGVRVELTYLASSESGQVFVVLRDRDVLFAECPLGDRVLGLHGAHIRVIPLELLKDGKSRPRDDPNEAAADRADFDALSRLAR